MIIQIWIGDGINPRIRFRLAQPNHKYGPYDEPTSTYTNIPYDPDSTIESQYSESSTILNVDTFGLSSIEENGLGWVGIGMKLVGPNKWSRSNCIKSPFGN